MSKFVSTSLKVLGAQAALIARDWKVFCLLLFWFILLFLFVEVFLSSFLTASNVYCAKLSLSEKKQQQKKYPINQFLVYAASNVQRK